MCDSKPRPTIFTLGPHYPATSRNMLTSTPDRYNARGKEYSQLAGPLPQCGRSQITTYPPREYQIRDWNSHKVTYSDDLVQVERPGKPVLSGNPTGPPRTPTRKDFIASRNSADYDFDSSERPAPTTNIFYDQETVAHAEFERKYAASKQYMVGGVFSTSHNEDFREDFDPKLWISGLQEFACYELLIDAYRICLYEELRLQPISTATIAKRNPITHFGEFLDSAHAHRILPTWWLDGGEEMNMTCIRLAMKKDGGASILQVFGIEDMIRKYGYPGIIDQLRDLATDVYGRDLAPRNDEFLREEFAMWFVDDYHDFWQSF